MFVRPDIHADSKLDQCTHDPLIGSRKVRLDASVLRVSLSARFLENPAIVRPVPGSRSVRAPSATASDGIRPKDPSTSIVCTFRAQMATK